MNDAPRYASFSDYLKVIRDHRWLVVACTILFALAAYLVSEQQTPMYESETSLEFVDPVISSVGNTVFRLEEQRAAIGARSATTADVARRAKRILRTDASVGELQGAVGANAEVRSNLVVIRARWRDPREAALIANAFARAIRDRETADVRRRVERAAAATRRNIASLPDTPEGRAVAISERSQLAELQQLARLSQPVSIVASATPAASPVTPRTTRNTVVAAIIGLAAGIALAFAHAALDRRLRTSAEVAQTAGYPVLGSIPDDALGRPLRSGGGRGDKPLADEDLEAFRIVRTNIDFLDVDRELSKILVTSALPAEGKSSVAVAIAAASALAGRRTLLLECDLRAPVFWKRLSINATPGLADFLGGKSVPGAVLQTVELPFHHAGDDGDRAKLVCITAGSKPPQPADLLSSSRFAQFIDQVSEAYDAVVIDAPPLLPVVDALELVQYAEAVVLCVRAHQTTRDEVKAARQALDRLPERPTGVVVTGVRDTDSMAYGYYGDRAGVT